MYELTERERNLEELKDTLTARQKSLLGMIIDTADVQEDWGGGDENGSVCIDDVQGTLNSLANVIRNL